MDVYYTNILCVLYTILTKLALGNIINIPNYLRMRWAK